jgi:putative CocE/NonD family hydrolase
MAAVSPETVSMRTRDGVRLDADVYRPDGSGPFPVLLMRMPYGRQIASTLCYAHPSWYADRGYIVVIQDVRGRGTSEGVFRLFADDVADGEDTVRWAAALQGSSGAVGMYGFSYQGTNQLLAASSGLAALKALAPAMIGWDIGSDWAYENNAFCLAAGLGWATQLGAETARLAGDEEAFCAFFRASGSSSFQSPIAARPDYIERFEKYTHYQAWLHNPPGSSYWHEISPALRARSLEVPMLFVGGWYDSHLPGTIAAFRHFASGGPERTRIVIGPWTHFPWTRSIGGHDFGTDAMTDIDQLQVRWFDYWLKGKNMGLAAEPPVRLFDMGENTWHDFPTWPQKSATLFLSGSGRASIDEGNGKLGSEPASREGTEFIVHDPWRPVPAVGGAYGTPPGPADRSVIDARPDVLTFTSEPALEPMALAGDVTAELWLVVDAPSFDVSCVVSRVSPNGGAMPLAQGYRLVKSGANLNHAIQIPMRATCATIKLGERVRLSIAGASFPAYPVNPGTGKNPTAASASEARIITIGLRHGGRYASWLRVGVA